MSAAELRDPRGARPDDHAVPHGVPDLSPVEESDVRQADPLRVRANQSKLLPRLINGNAIRRGVDEGLDRLRLRLDSFPHGVYQPVDLPVRRAKRATGSRSRWDEIEQIVDRLMPRTAMDLGANAGYFSIQLGRLGVQTVAVDSEPGTLRTAAFAIRRSKVDNVALLALELTRESARLLPRVDATLFLSLWHHLVLHQGIDRATTITERIWEHTARVLIFDTGEDEMGPGFRLPALEPTPQAWLTGYLAATCAGSRVEHLGLHDAFDGEGRPCKRNLFAVIREHDGRS